MNALMNPSTIELATGSAETMSMSTLEIAELTGKRHDNVLYDTRCMLLQLGLASTEFSGHIEVPGPNGGMRRSPLFNLPKDLTLTLVTGYSAPLRHKIVVRWMELEARLRAPALPNFADPAEAAARAWAVEYEARQALALEAWESLSFS